MDKFFLCNELCFLRLPKLANNCEKTCMHFLHVVKGGREFIHVYPSLSVFKV